MSSQPIPIQNTLDDFLKSQQSSDTTNTLGQFLQLPPKGTQIPGADPSSLIKNLPQVVPGLLTGLGATAGEIAWPPGGAYLGAGAGSLAGQALQRLAPSIFGEGPQNLQQIIGQTGEDVASQGLTSLLTKVAGNGLLPALAQVPGISKLPAVRTAAAEAGLAANEKAIANRVFPQSMIMETAAQNAQDNINSKIALANRVQPPNPGVENLINSQFGGSGHDLLNIPYQQTTARTLALNKVADKVLSDVTEVRNFKLATGEPDTVNQLAMNKLGKIAIKGDGTFNPDAALNELKGENSDIYDEALKPQVKSNIEDILTTAQSQQKYLKGQKPVLLFKGGDWILPAAAGYVGGAGAAEAVAGIRIGSRLVMKMASDPALGKAILVGMKTPATSSAAPLIQKMILHSMVGETVDLPDGKKATVDPNGNPQPQ